MKKALFSLACALLALPSVAQAPQGALFNLPSLNCVTRLESFTGGLAVVGCSGLFDTGTQLLYKGTPIGTGSGVTSITWTVPSWLTPTPLTLSAGGTQTFSPTTGQASHQVIGTCGTATIFAPCTLVAGDIPALSYLANSTQLPVTLAASAHLFFTSYTSSTGVYTAAQVNYSDLAGAIPNAPTATALAATPSQCSGGTPVATGIAANGNANCAAASGSGLTSFTVGNLSPIFTATLGASPTTAPALAYALSSTSQNFFLAGPTSGSGVPAYRAIVAGDIPTSLPAVSIGGNAATATSATSATTATTATSATTATTAANLSGTPALPNGTTATTQAASDSSTKLQTTAGVQAVFAAPPAIGSGTPAAGSFTTVSATGGVSATADGVHAGKVELVGNTTLPALDANTIADVGPNVATFTAYGKQWPSVGPSVASLPCLSALSSAVSTVSYCAAPAGTIVGTTDTQTLTNKTIDGVSPATMALLDATSSIQTQLNAKASLASPTFTGTPMAPTPTAKDNSTKVATTAYVDAPTGLTAGTSVTLVGPRQYFVCTAACTITVPVPAAGNEFCVLNDDNVATVITLSAIGTSARYENTARTAYGTAGTGTFISGGAVGDKVCLVGRDTTHYLTASFVGTWTAN